VDAANLISDKQGDIGSVHPDAMGSHHVGTKQAKVVKVGRRGEAELAADVGDLALGLGKMD
jgi:hypothetical protein